MNSEQFNRWLVLGANIGVLVGLLLVLLQMNQNEELLRVQIMNEYFEAYIEAETTFAGENLPAIWQKALEEPENLSVAEMRVMEAQTFAPLSRWINLYRLAEAGIVSDSFWKSQVDMDTTYYFSSPYGRAWWEYFGTTIPETYLPSALKKAINEKLATESNNRVLEHFREVQRIIRRNLKETDQLESTDN